jgi:hypothetical protein
MIEKVFVNFAFSVLFQLLATLEPVAIDAFKAAFAKLYVTLQQKLGADPQFATMVSDRGGQLPPAQPPTTG